MPLEQLAVQDFLKSFNPYCRMIDISDFFGIPYPTVHAWVRDGKLPVTKIAGQDPKILLSDLIKFASTPDELPYREGRQR